MLRNSKSTFRTITVKLQNKGKRQKCLKLPEGKNADYLTIRLTTDRNHSNNRRQKWQWNNIIKCYGKIILNHKIYTQLDHPSIMKVKLILFSEKTESISHKAFLKELKGCTPGRKNWNSEWSGGLQDVKTVKTLVYMYINLINTDF